MRLLRRPELRVLLLIAIGAGAWLTVRHSHAPQPTAAATGPVSWSGLVGSSRPAVDLSGRYIVVLDTPSVAERVAKVGLATESAERRWTAEVLAAQQQVLLQLARHGFAVRPDYTYARVLDGFSAQLDPRAAFRCTLPPDRVRPRSRRARAHIDRGRRARDPSLAASAWCARSAGPPAPLRVPRADG